MTLPLALPKDFRKPSCTPGRTPIVAGNAFIFGPDQPHQLTNDGSQDIVLYIERITRSASHAIILTARNGSCAHPNPDIRAPRTRKEEPDEMAGIIGEAPFQLLTRLALPQRTRSYLTGLKVR